MHGVKTEPEAKLHQKSRKKKKRKKERNNTKKPTTAFLCNLSPARPTRQQHISASRCLHHTDLGLGGEKGGTEHPHVPLDGAALQSWVSPRSHGAGRSWGKMRLKRRRRIPHCTLSACCGLSCFKLWKTEGGMLLQMPERERRQRREREEGRRRSSAFPSSEQQQAGEIPALLIPGGTDGEGKNPEPPPGCKGLSRARQPGWGLSPALPIWVMFAAFRQCQAWLQSSRARGRPAGSSVHGCTCTWTHAHMHAHTHAHTHAYAHKHCRWGDADASSCSREQPGGCSRHSSFLLQRQACSSPFHPSCLSLLSLSPASPAAAPAGFYGNSAGKHGSH